MVNHKYSTYTLIGIIFLFTIAILGSALTSSDLDLVCNVDESFLYKGNGVWGCGQFDFSQFNITFTNLSLVQINKTYVAEDFMYLNASNSDIHYLNFNTSNCNTDTATEGQVCWNSDKQTLNIVSGLGTTLQVGQEMTRAVRNQADKTIYNGQVVYISGSSGEIETVELADASDGNKIHNLAMVTATSCNDNAFCQVTTVGLVHDIDTSAFTEGDDVYLSADGSGNISTTRPNYPNYNIHLGTITRSHINTGMIAFSPDIDMGDGVTINSLGIKEDLHVDGNFTSNQIYGEIWADTDAGATFLIPTYNVYYNVSGNNLTCGLNNGFSCSSSVLTAQVAGVYEIGWDFAFTGGANDNYHMGVVKNYNTSYRKCFSRRASSTTNIGSVSDGCYLQLEIGDTLSAIIEDETNPANDITIYHGSIKATRIGN